MKLNIDHLKLLCKPQSELCLNQKSQGLFGSHLCFAELRKEFNPSGSIALQQHH